VTNLREFALYGIEADGRPARLEHITLAGDGDDFRERHRHPRALAQRDGPRTPRVPAPGHAARGAARRPAGRRQVIKKWLSYRERGLLGRDLTPDVARYVTEMVRRSAAILLLHPQLDASYAAVKAATYAWPQRT
jgi:hypothetical protein